MRVKQRGEGHIGIAEDVEKAAYFFDVCSDAHNKCHNCPEAVNCLAIWDNMLSRIHGTSKYHVEYGVKPPLMIK